MKKKFGLTKFCLVWQNLEFRQTDVWQKLWSISTALMWGFIIAM